MLSSVFGSSNASSSDRYGKWESIPQQDVELGDMKVSGSGDAHASGGSSSGGGVAAWFGNLFSGEAAPPVQPAVSDALCFGLIKLPEFSYFQRLAGFGLCFASGFVMLSMALFMVPSILIGGSSKFALSYVFGNICLLSSITFLVGLNQQIESMFHESRKIVSIVYLASMFFVIWVCFTHPTFLLVLPSLAVQFGSLLWYICSYTPCGDSAMQSMTSMFVRSMVPTSLSSLTQGGQ